MNMKYRFSTLLFILTLLLSTIEPVFAQAKTPLSGINLDVSNRYYSVKQIQKYINLAAKAKNGYVQLHFTGDRNVGIECKSLNQIAKKKYRHKNGAFYNPKTGRSFLSQKQIQIILAYAEKKKVEIIPEIDMPGHMGGFEKLYLLKYKKSNPKIFHADYQGELAIRNPQAISFAKKIYKEYATLFSDCNYFHMGCDEFWSGSAKTNASYLNTISEYLEKKGFTVLAWNDLFTKTNISSINHNLLVTYWSYDGDTCDAATKARRRKLRASFPLLQEEGFTLFNYNSYYLYLTPSPSTISKEDTEYAVKDAKENWNLLVWDSDYGKKSKTPANIAGACISVWGEDSKGVKSSDIYNQVQKLYEVTLI
ncbi:MAG: family 20 glycosylhydrolase [Lachnospiraceae bacterium]|nr:family 20 glycosylhydrolase [Lachnospiraceae bacterium]